MQAGTCCESSDEDSYFWQSMQRHPSCSCCCTSILLCHWPCHQLRTAQRAGPVKHRPTHDQQGCVQAFQTWGRLGCQSWSAWKH